MPKRPSPEPVCDQRIFGRRLFLHHFALGAAAMAVGPLATRALGNAVPFIPPEEGVELLPDGAAPFLKRSATVAKSAYAAYPSMAVTRAGQPWASWAEETDGMSVIRVQSLDPEKDSPGTVETLAVSAAGWSAYQPAMAASGDRVAVVWTETDGKAWRIRFAERVAGSGAPAAPWTVAESSEPGSAVWRPSVAAAADGPFLLAWENKPRGDAAFQVCFCHVKPGAVTASEFFAVDDGTKGDACRPSVAAAAGGDRFGIVWDRYTGDGTTHVFVAEYRAGENRPIAPPKQVTRHPATNLAPDCRYSPDADTLWIAWHTNARGDDEWDIPRWYRVAALDVATGRLMQPAWPPPMMDLEKTGTDQGIEFVRLACAPDGTLCVLARASQRFVLQAYRGDRWSPIYRFPREGWGGRGQHAPGSFDSKGRLWVVRRDIGANIVECVEGIPAGKTVRPFLGAMTAQPSAVTAVLRNRTPHLEFPAIPEKPAAEGEKEPAEGYQVYFGDIHAHSWMSDGMGDVDEHYRRARDIFSDDFCAVTDHDNFVDRKLLTAEYEEQKAIAAHFDDPGRFVSLYAQEWTTPRTDRPHGFGHKNLYGPGRDIPLFDHKDARFQDAPQLYAALRERRMICIPHHVGWTGVDWEAVGTDVQPLVEICSVHGVFEYQGNTPIPHRGGLPGMFVRDGLARGIKFGFTGGSDQHGLIWQHGVAHKRDAYRAGLTGVLAKELTRDAILDAMRQRRTFATTGAKLRPAFRVSGSLMGSEIRVSKAPVVSVDVLALAPVKWITIVRDGEDIQKSGGEGPRTRTTFVDGKWPGKGTSYYYARIELADGNMAWTSPVWVTPA